MTVDAALLAEVLRLHHDLDSFNGATDIPDDIRRHILAELRSASPRVKRSRAYNALRKAHVHVVPLRCTYAGCGSSAHLEDTCLRKRRDIKRQRKAEMRGRGAAPSATSEPPTPSALPAVQPESTESIFDAPLTVNESRAISWTKSAKGKAQAIIGVCQRVDGQQRFEEADARLQALNPNVPIPHVLFPELELDKDDPLLQTYRDLKLVDNHARMPGDDVYSIARQRRRAAEIGGPWAEWVAKGVGAAAVAVAGAAPLVLPVCAVAVVVAAGGVLAYRALNKPRK